METVDADTGLKVCSDIRTFDGFDLACRSFDKGAPVPPGGELLYYSNSLGEAGEVQGEVKKMYRDDGGVLTKERRDKIILELGDTMWYMSRIAKLCGSSLEDVARQNVAKLTARRSGNPGKYGTGG